MRWMLFLLFNRIYKMIMVDNILDNHIMKETAKYNNLDNHKNSKDPSLVQAAQSWVWILSSSMCNNWESKNSRPNNNSIDKVIIQLQIKHHLKNLWDLSKSYNINNLRVVIKNQLLKKNQRKAQEANMILEPRRAST